MKLTSLFVYLSIPAWVTFGAFAVESQRDPLVSPSGACEVTTATSGMGGAKELSLRRGSSSIPVAKDVTAMLWRSPNHLLYSVSPVYGIPGLFELDCKTSKSKTIVAAAVKDRAYPDGADYFELVSVDSLKSEACYYYSAHVDQTKFDTFRNPKNIRCVATK
jgi:hypothetical protein